MQTPKTLEKTQYVTIDNQTVPLNRLPAEIVAEIETLDIYRQQLNDLMFDVEKYQILTQVKTAQVQELLKAWAKPASTSEEAE